MAVAAETPINQPRAIDTPPPSEQQGEESQPADFFLSQAGTTVETVRIEDPDDSETYVDVQRRVTETFTDQDGKLWRFVRTY
ncbi:MAG: hypothetical protein U5L11_02505 [Arhodomonas sp.]|nr:hypothetical protein [Arhodomonas sp.]